MTRRKTDMQVSRLEKEVQILASGAPAAAYAAREVLSLDPPASPLLIVQAVHNAIHRYQSDRTVEALWATRTAIYAARILLRQLQRDEK